MNQEERKKYCKMRFYHCTLLVENDHIHYKE